MLGRSSKKRIILPIGAALLAFSFALPVAAADYAEEYRQYNEALAAGDQEAATVHALAAWKGAEAALGDHRTTAILAYNYGQQVLFEAPSEALPALKRAKELQDAGVAALPVDDLRLYLAFAEFKVAGERGADAFDLRSAANKRDSSNEKASAQSSYIWLELAKYDVAVEKYDVAADSAEKAEKSLEDAIPNDYRARAQAITLRGIAALLPITYVTYRISEAHSHFNRAIGMFPLQTSIDSFDPVLAQAIAWDRTAHAALYSKRIDYKARTIAETWPEMPLFLSRDVEFSECKPDWGERKPPQYPALAERNYYIGVALIGYHLNEDGAVRDARVLAEVPHAVFGETALESMSAWKVKDPSKIPPECMTDLWTVFTFQH